MQHMRRPGVREICKQTCNHDYSRMMNNSLFFFVVAFGDFPWRKHMIDQFDHQITTSHHNYHFVYWSIYPMFIQHPLIQCCEGLPVRPFHRGDRGFIMHLVRLDLWIWAYRILKDLGWYQYLLHDPPADWSGWFTKCKVVSKIRNQVQDHSKHCHFHCRWPNHRPWHFSGNASFWSPFKRILPSFLFAPKTSLWTSRHQYNSPHHSTPAIQQHQAASLTQVLIQKSVVNSWGGEPCRGSTVELRPCGVRSPGSATDRWAWHEAMAG